MKRLIVKNFGPLKDIDIELRDINLFIGENGTGKSILAKIITIISNFDGSNEKDLLKKFNKYNIFFITNKSIIKLYDKDDNEPLLELKNNNFLFYKELIKLKKNFQNEKKLKEKIKENFPIDIKSENIILFLKELLLKEQSKKYESILSQIDIVEDSMKKIYKLTTSQYIPAERNLISLFNKSLSTLIVNEIPLPKFLLRFTSEFEKAGNEIKELEFLNVKYLNGDGLDRHKIYFNDKDYLPLEYSSSGIQSALPLYLTTKYFANKHHSIIIEEPELNLFPKAQYETLKFIIENKSISTTIMTHSPYILSTLNILMMAYKAGNLNEQSKAEVSELFNEKQWINPNDFSAYYLENGMARDIKGRTGLISDNEIDEVSNDIQFDFEELLTIYREHKNDK